jgi:hypothetical protein
MNQTSGRGASHSWRLSFRVLLIITQNKKSITRMQFQIHSWETQSFPTRHLVAHRICMHPFSFAETPFPGFSWPRGLRCLSCDTGSDGTSQWDTRDKSAERGLHQGQVCRFSFNSFRNNIFSFPLTHPIHVWWTRRCCCCCDGEVRR